MQTGSSQYPNSAKWLTCGKYFLYSRNLPYGFYQSLPKQCALDHQFYEKRYEGKKRFGTHWILFKIHNIQQLIKIVFKTTFIPEPMKHIWLLESFSCITLTSYAITLVRITFWETKTINAHPLVAHSHQTRPF